jgi:PKD domain
LCAFYARRTIAPQIQDLCSNLLLPRKDDSDSDDVSVGVAEVQNVFPKADAEGNQQAEVNTEAKLDGSKNSDEDGEIVSYKWEQTDGPEADLKHSDE